MAYVRVISQSTDFFSLHDKINMSCTVLVLGVEYGTLYFVFSHCIKRN